VYRHRKSRNQAGGTGFTGSPTGREPRNPEPEAAEDCLLRAGYHTGKTGFQMAAEIHRQAAPHQTGSSE